jgi:hypothetical protein
MPPRVSREEWDRRAAAAGIEWVGDEPIHVMTKHAARCLACGCEWDARPNDVQQGTGCPPCRRKAAGLRRRLPREEWDRRAAAVDVEWVGDEPVLAYLPHAARCTRCGYEWDVSPDHVRGGQGCPPCAFGAPRGPRITAQDWDRRAAAVDLEWVGDEPILSTTKHAVRCLVCGHEWDVKPSHVMDGQGCRSCSGRAPLTREEWDQRAAAVDTEWLGSGPIQSNIKRAIRCLKCGHEWNVWPGSVASGAGCQPCGQIATRVPREEWNRRAAAVDIEWVGDEPILSTTKHAVRCLTCQHEWRVLPDSVAAGHGCSGCAKSGFDLVAPATVYLIRHDAGPFVKVGITGADPIIRLAAHGRRGWEILGTWPIPVGRDAALIESRVVEWWQERGATRCTRDEVPNGDGWTEAVHIGPAADEPSTIAYIEELVAEVGGGY